ncbi:hypothetical protein LXL04_024127 [Taraxacum kok-saghyz]
MHVRTTVWPASLVLVKFVEPWLSSTSTIDNPYATVLQFHNKRVVELGTDCGVAAMGLYLLGLKDVVLTDIAPVMPALKHNLKRNKTVLEQLVGPLLAAMESMVSDTGVCHMIIFIQNMHMKRVTCISCERSCKNHTIR